MKTRARQIFADQYDVLMACGALPDTGTLRAYAIALEEMEEAQADIDKRGAILTVAKVEKPNPYVQVRDRALERVERLGKLMGLGNFPNITPERLRATAHGNEKGLPTAQISLALDECMGVISHAAAMLGIKSNTLSKFIQGSGYLLAQQLEIKNRLKDFAENNISRAMAAGDLRVSMWFLEQQAADRGYGKKGLLLPPPPDPSASDWDLSKLTLEQLHDFEQLRAVAGAPKDASKPGSDPGRDPPTLN